MLVLTLVLTDLDLVFKRGAGSALLEHASKLGSSLTGMSRVLGDIPLTIKLRTGVRENHNVAHKLVPRLAKEWGVGAATLHGRTRAQRYSRPADYSYIRHVVDVMRDAAEAEDVAPIPFLGNGDAYDWREYWRNVEYAGLDGIMVACVENFRYQADGTRRGSLIKPWIFTEIKERRDWDIRCADRGL